MKKIISLFIIGVICWLPNLDAQEEDRQSEINLVQIEKEYKFLKGQLENYQSFIERERKEHRQFLEDIYKKIVWFSGIASSIVLGILIFLGIRTKKEISTSIDKLFEEHGLKIINERNENIRLKLKELENLLKRETNYKNRHILYIMSESDKDSFNNRELTIIKERGFKENQIETYSEKVLDSIKRRSYDVLVYYYNPPAEKHENTGDKNLQEILKYLKERSAKIPIIIYTYKKAEHNRLYSIDNEEAAKYPYAVVANFPITLVNLLHTVTNYFPIEGK